MKTLVVMATWVCWAILVLILPVLVMPSTIEETLAAPRPRPPPPPPTPDYPTVTLNLDEPKTYPPFLASLRPKLTAGGSIVCGIPETPSRKTKKRFVLVDLKAKDKDTEQDLLFTVAIDVASAYVVAYRDNKGVGYFFKLKDEEAYEVAKNLFKGGTRKELKFGESYGAMESYAHVKDGRINLELGVNKLAKAIINLNNYKSKDKKEDKLMEYQSRFLLIAIQMISEAARFPYIEQKVVDNEKYGFKPDVKTISLETNWGSLSKGIQGSSAKPIPDKCKVMGRTVTINIGKNGETLVVKTVDQAKHEVNFIKRDENTKLRSVSQFDQIISSIVAQDGDDFATVLEAGNL